MNLTTSPDLLESATLVPVCTNIIVIEKHDELRKRLVLLIDGQENCRCVGTAVDAVTALKLVKDLRPDLVVMELAISGDCGFELLRRLKDEHPEVRRLIFSAHWDLAYVQRARDAEVDGYVFKANPQELIPALQSIIAGKPFFGVGAAVA